MKRSVAATLLIVILAAFGICCGYFFLRETLNSSPQDETTEVDVGVFYYVWYEEGNDTRHWNDEPCDNVVDLPVLDYYSSQNESVIKNHLDWMKDIGLDFLIISWWGENSYEDNSTKIIFDVVEEYASDWMELAIMVEGFNDSQGPDGYDFTIIYEYLLNTYIEPYSDIYMRLNNKPLVCWFNFENMTIPKPNRDAIYAETRVEARIVGHSNYVDWWFGIPCSVDDNTKPTIYMDNEICIEPRYDNQYLGKDKNYTFDATYEQGIYDIEWNEVIKYAREGSVSLVTIYSWNEFHERSQIEPCYDKTSNYTDPYYLFNATKTYIHELKG